MPSNLQVFRYSGGFGDEYGCFLKSKRPLRDIGLMWVIYVYIYVYLSYCARPASLRKATPVWSQQIIIVIAGTPKMRNPHFGNPHMGMHLSSKAEIVH